MTPPAAQPPTDRTPAPRFTKALSLERKLPLLMTAVLAVILASSLALTYRTLIWSAETAARERLARAARQVASTAELATQQRATLLREVAGDAAVRRALLARADGDRAGLPGEGAPLVRRALARLLTRADTGLAVELWDAQGQVYTLVGPDRRRAGDETPLVEALAGDNGNPGADDPAAVRFGPMYPSQGRVYYWGIAPVVENGVRIGYVAQQRRVGGPRDASRALQALIGQDVELYLRNAAGTFWASAPGIPSSAPTIVDSGATGPVYLRPGLGRVIAGEDAIAGGPWLAVLESPLRSVHAPARRTVFTLALLSLALTAVGAALSWVISRRITRPLGALTTAAESIAKGDYARRVEVDRRDELGRVSAAFNQMASEVAASRYELEQRFEDARAGAEALERANQRLQAAIREAEQARVEAERANQAKGDFLAVMSHELRTPLNAIGGYAQLLELEVHGPVTEAQREALARIGRSQAHLLRLINDVLNFARIDAGQVEYEITDVSLDETLTELEAMVAPQMRAKQLAFSYRPCGAHVTALADREKLQQIVLNLLTNATKFTPVGGRVVVECDADEEFARVRVRDTGIGVPAERLRSIFEPFVQADRALNRPNEGVGLGLAISRDLARGMGGDVVVESEVGGGSVFTVSLPRGRAAVPAPPEEQAARARHPV
jgi:signal transduction histidine kinase